MDDVVVEDQMNHLSSTIASPQSAQQVQEEPAPFLVAFNPDQMARALAQGSGEEAFLVLPGRENPALLSRQGPVGTDSRIQVEVHFVDVEGFLVPFQSGKQRADLSQTSLATSLSPGAQHPSRSSAPSGAQDFQAGPERGSTDANSRAPGHLPSQQLPAPAGAFPSTIGRGQPQELSESLQEALVHLPVAILLPLILQSSISLGEIPPGGPADVSPGYLQVPLDNHRASAFGQQHDDQVALAQLGVPRFLSPTRKSSTYLPGD